MAPSKKSPLKLHLGCGAHHKEGWVNVDVFPDVKPDRVWDLNKTPWPWKSNSVDRILAEHVIEHVNDFAVFLRECHRILKPGCRAIIATPHASYGWMHPYHLTAFTVNTFHYYNMYNPQHRFDKVSERMIYSRATPLLPLAIPLTLLANLGTWSRKLCERVWAYWFGGFEEIRWVLEKPR